MLLLVAAVRLQLPLPPLLLLVLLLAVVQFDMQAALPLASQLQFAATNAASCLLRGTLPTVFAQAAAAFLPQRPGPDDVALGVRKALPAWPVQRVDPGFRGGGAVLPIPHACSMVQQMAGRCAHGCEGGAGVKTAIACDG